MSGRGARQGRHPARPVGPPSLDGRVLRHVDPADRADALQEAWVAHLECGHSNAAVWAFAKRRARARRRCVCFSQLPVEQRRRIEREWAG